MAGLAPGGPFGFDRSCLAAGRFRHCGLVLRRSSPARTPLSWLRRGRHGHEVDSAALAPLQHADQLFRLDGDGVDHPAMVSLAGHYGFEEHFPFGGCPWVDECRRRLAQHFEQLQAGAGWPIDAGSIAGHFR